MMNLSKRKTYMLTNLNKTKLTTYQTLTIYDHGRVVHKQPAWISDFVTDLLMLIDVFFF